MKLFSLFVELLACVISFGLNIYVLSARYPARRKIRWWEYGIWGGLFTFVTYYEIFSNMTASFIGMAICVSFGLICLTGRWIGKFLTVVIVNIFTIMISILCLQSFAIIFHTNTVSLTLYGNTFHMIELFFMKMLCIFCAYTGVKFFQVKNYLKQKEFFIVLFFFLCFFGVAFFSLNVIYYVPLPQTQQYLFIGLNLLFFAVNILILFLVKKLNLQNRLQLENAVLRTQLSEQEHSLKNIEETNRRIRLLRHDMKSYLFSYLELLKEGSTQSVIEDIEKKLNQQLSYDSTYYTEDSLINSLLNQKQERCRREHIACEIKLQPLGEPAAIEFAVLMSNLIDNAIEAELEEDEALRRIQIYLTPLESGINLIVRNYIRTSVLENNPDLLTTKAFPSRHGLGLYGVKRIVEEKDGLIAIVEEGNFFVVHIVYPTVFIK